MTDVRPIRSLLFAALAAAGVLAGRADTISLSAVAGENYEALSLKPTVSGAAEGATLTLAVTDSTGVRTVATELPVTTSARLFENLTAARFAALDGYVMASDGVSTNAAAHDLFLLGRAHDDDWIREDASTYEDESGSGEWTGREYATASAGLIRINTTVGGSSTAAVECAVSPVPGSCRGFTLATEAVFAAVSAELPDPTGQRLGITIARPYDDDTNIVAFAYVENGDWTVVPGAVCDPSVSTNWQIRIAVDQTGETATYYARPSSSDAWAVLGTAENVGAESVTVASFRGEGAIARVEGNGFDTYLLDVRVEFSIDNLYPGCNFENTIVTGRVVSTVIQETSRLGGSFVVYLKDLDGTVIETRDFAFTGDNTMEFYVPASELTPGASYSAEVWFDIEGEAETEDVATLPAVMGRPVTNATWGVHGFWVEETARTFDGDDPGTGDWTNREHTETEDGWIRVGVGLEEEESTGLPLVFEPTNAVTDTMACYVTSIRAVFSEDTADLDDADGEFGVTLAYADEGLAFMCISNRTWQAVPHAVAVPALDTEYEFFFYVHKDGLRLDYLVQLPTGEKVHLMTVRQDSDLLERFSRVDIAGIGRVADLTGRVYSTDFLRLQVDFSENTLYPGTNFEATAANGVISFTRLWETDHTNGVLRVVLRDKYGAVVGQRRISFHDLADRTFEYYVTGLQPGETYSVEVTADVKGVTGDTSDSSGLMARIVTNANWTAEGWIRENVETFKRRAPGTGDWIYEEGMAEETEDGTISINTTASEDADAHVGFLATNEVPRHTGYELRSQLRFDAACYSLPSIEGDFGVTVVNADSGSSSASVQFAILRDGVWTAIPTALYAPQLGVEYEVTVRVDQKRSLACYEIRGPREDLPTVIAEFELPDASGEPLEAAYYGVGRVRTHEGDAFDVSLVEVSADFDRPIVPGTNFTEAAAGGVLHITRLWDTDRTSGEYTIVVRDAHGGLVATRTLSYTELVDQRFDVFFEDLEAGKVYDIDILAEDLAGEATSNRVTAVMARPIGAWIHENAATFAREETGTGVWLGTNDTAWVIGTAAGRAIRIDSSEAGRNVVYEPTNVTLSVTKSTVREIRLDVDFENPGWFASDKAPTVPTNSLAAVTVWCDDSVEDEASQPTALAVVSTNGTWLVLEGTRRPASEQMISEVFILIDFRNGYVRYDAVSGTQTNTLHLYDIESSDPRALHLGFSGAGSVRAVDGDVWDPNLIASSTDEFADLQTAIDATDPDEMLRPLWCANQWVTAERGSFKVDDPEHLLTVNFPWWYYVEIATNGSVRVFRFNQSNNWIDYAADGDENIVVDGSVFLVKTPEGLSWIAALATNDWVSGRIELDGDIDLTKHNWTPIAGFSGTFDGKGRTIRGLNNSYHNVGIPGGEYVSGPTNAWGRSAYGLFATATNATLTGVTFAEVAISNVADSVAALAGALAGNCAVSNVTVASGSILGLGGTVAGVAGFADFADFLTFVNNTNRASVAADSALYGETRTAAGLLCVAGPTDPDAPLGTLVVTNNVNAGVVSNTVYDTDLQGGNVAGILAGAVAGARFGDVRLTNNVVSGTVEATLVRSPENVIDVTGFPAVNLAASFWGYDPEGTFYRHLDANADGAVPVDPYRRTARMLSGLFPNGTVNTGGLLNDEITTRLPGGTVTMTEGFDSWGPIVLDRDLVFDLGGKMIYTVYINNTFLISNGVAATVRNGTIAVGPESLPFAGDTNNLTTSNLAIQNLPDEFYERTTVSVNGEPISTLYATELAAAINASGTVIELYEGAEVDIDVSSGTLKVGGNVVAKLSECYGFSAVTGADGTVLGFEVKILDSAAPTAEFTLTGGAEGTVNVTVGNAKAGFWYALQHKASLAEKWITPPAAEWVRADSNGATLTAPSDGAQGYYRILMSDVPGTQVP